MYRWPSVALVSAAVVGALVLVFSQLTESSAQQPKGDRGKPAPAAAAPAAPTVQRTETTNFDSWQVTCQETDTSKRKVCSAVLHALDQQRRPIVTWIMGRNPEGALVTVLQTPQTQVGLNIQKGVELKLGNGAVRKLAYVACNSTRCESSLPMDDAVMREIMAAPATVVTIYQADGKAITINLPSITGSDKALAAVGRG
jgi:invasion protein IalB